MREGEKPLERSHTLEQNQPKFLQKAPPYSLIKGLHVGCQYEKKEPSSLKPLKTSNLTNHVENC